MAPGRRRPEINQTTAGMLPKERQRYGSSRDSSELGHRQTDLGSMYNMELQSALAGCLSGNFIRRFNDRFLLWTGQTLEFYQYLFFPDVFGNMQQEGDVGNYSALGIRLC